MSRLVRSEGLVLKSRPFSESSKIATLLVREGGRIDVLAHGARKPGSRFGAALEPGTEANFIYYEREERSLWTLSSADIVVSHQGLRENAKSLLMLGRMLRFLHHLSQPGEANIGLYNLTMTILNAMENGNISSTLFEFYLWRTARVSGYLPRITDGCIVCGKEAGRKFSIPEGGFLCSEHASNTEGLINLTPSETNILVRLSECSASELSEDSITLPSLVSRLIRRYVSYHLHVPDHLIE